MRAQRLSRATTATRAGRRCAHAPPPSSSPRWNTSTTTSTWWTRASGSNGGHVYFADDAAQANAIVLDIAKRNGVKTVIKSKSMVSEEMGINHVLEREGIEPVETDLGEYIIQLAGETPFHIIAPAMHKTRQEVSTLFQEWLKTAPTQDIKRLCEYARDALREKFAVADMGISGANFVVAETGTVCLVTNEGNGRMTTSAPRIHVALAGMEKIVPAIEDSGSLPAPAAALRHRPAHHELQHVRGRPSCAERRGRA